MTRRSKPPAEVGKAPPGLLAGVRVLEFSHFLAGPYAGLILADLGADVVKLEDPDRPDEARTMGPHFVSGESLYFAALNWGKRSVGIRLGTPDGHQGLHDLLDWADVLVTNYRLSVLAKLGLDERALRSAHPRLVSCSVTGYGGTGPDTDRPGYDYTIQAAGAAMGLAGAPGGPPVKAGISYVDHAGGLAAALAVCAGLVSRGLTGRGSHLDLGLLDLQVSMLTYLAAWSLNAGFEPVPMSDSAHPSLVPAQNFQTADGWLAVFVGNDSMWRRLVKVLGEPGLDDPAYATREGRAIHRDPLVNRLKSVFLEDSAVEWARRLGRAGVASSPVNTIAGALADRQVRARGMITRSAHRAYGNYRHVIGPFPTLAAARPIGAPLLGEHTREVLVELGYDDVKLAELAGGGGWAG